MKNYDERIESIFRKYDERLVEKKRRKAMILRSFAIGVGAAAVLGVGLTTYALRPPNKPVPNQSDIIVETETTSAETTASPTSLSTTTPNTTVTKQVTTTAVSTTATTSSARQTTTTARTTATAARTTMTAVNTTAVVTTSVTVQTTAAMTTTGCVATNEIPTGSTEHIPWKRVIFGEKETYRMCSRDNEQIIAAAEDIGEYYGEGTLMIDDEQSACKLYAYKNYSPTYVCAIKETEDSEPKLYSAFVKCDTLGELLEATDFENTVVIKEAYKGLGEPYSVPFERTPTISDLMKVLSDTSQERSDTSLATTRSYTLRVEIPELGIEHSQISILRTFGETGYISFDVYGVKCTYNIGVKKLDEFIRTFDESYSPEIVIN